jgi:tetratricopeptide (TPR) repeat protein
MDSRLPAGRSRAIGGLASLLMAIGLLAVLAVREKPWDQALLNLRFLRAAATTEQAAGCQVAWQSRALAGYKLRQAQTSLGAALGCDRSDLVQAWAGMPGNPAEARTQWSALAPTALAQWGLSEVAQGDLERGRTLLKMALAHSNAALPTERQAAISIALGDTYRQQKDWASAVEWYRQARHLGVRTAGLAFKLGSTYRQMGHYDAALTALRVDLDTVSAASPVLALNYWLEIGENYERMGNRPQARAAYQAAEEILEAGADNLTAEQAARQGQRIRRLLDRGAP